MNRPRTLLVLAVLLAGCRSTPQGDPFLLGRSTIPPPGTGTIGQAGGQASLAPPNVTVPPQTAPLTAPPTMNAAPVTPGPPSMNAPPAANPYNFHQGSLKSSSTDETASAWTPTRQTVTTTNRASGSDVPTTVTAGKTTASAATEAASTATEIEPDTTKTEIKVTSLQESSDRVSSKSASNNTLPEPAHFTPSGSVIRIVEPGAKSDADSAAQAKPTSAMTASSFQPQWRQKWTDSAAE
jgi:hypothetical protein